MFYSNEEFNFQVDQLMYEEGYSFAEACGIVQARMEEDEREYNEWRAEQERLAELEEQDEYYPDPDSAYEDQYELDTDYL